MHDPFEWEYYLMLALLTVAGGIVSSIFGFFWYEVLR